MYFFGTFHAVDLPYATIHHCDITRTEHHGLAPRNGTLFSTPLRGISTLDILPG